MSKKNILHMISPQEESSLEGTPSDPRFAYVKYEKK